MWSGIITIMKIKRNTITILAVDHHNKVKRITRLETIGEAKQRIASQKAQKQTDKEHMERAVPLSCDVCGGEIGYVYENDLNGSRFYHASCINK